MFSNKWSAFHAHALKVLIMNKDFPKTIPVDILKYVFLEALFFTVPLALPDRPENWIFRSTGKDSRMDGLNFPMGGSVVYKKRALVIAGNPSPPKKAAKKGTVAHAAAELGNCDDVISDKCEDGTPKLWLHDLVQCIESPTDRLRILVQDLNSSDEEAIEQSVRWAIREGLSFCFTGKAVQNGKEVKTWSAVRKHIKEQNVKYHLLDNVT